MWYNKNGGRKMQYQSKQEKLKKAQMIYLHEIEKVKQSAEMWQDFLDFAAKTSVSKNQSDYEFATKLSIHAVNPNAKICRTFDEVRKWHICLIQAKLYLTKNLNVW